METVSNFNSPNNKGFVVIFLPKLDINLRFTNIKQPTKINKYIHIRLKGTTTDTLELLALKSKNTFEMNENESLKQS